MTRIQEASVRRSASDSYPGGQAVMWLLYGTSSRSITRIQVANVSLVRVARMQERQCVTRTKEAIASRSGNNSYPRGQAVVRLNPIQEGS